MRPLEMFRLTLFVCVFLAVAAPAPGQLFSGSWGYSTALEGRPPNQTTIVTITNYNGPSGATAIPEQIEGFTVARVGNGSVTIDPQSRLTGVVIPGTVTNIADFAFRRGTNLTAVTLGHGVRNIGRDAFSDCGNLSEITIPDSVTSIGLQTFLRGTNLASATLGNGLTELPYAMFGNCPSLAEIIIPPGVTNIGQYAFANAVGLTNVLIPAGVTNIGDYAFAHCRSLPGLVIPDTVTTIGRNAFASCFDLASIDLGQGLTNIGYAALIYCDSLTSVTFPNGLTQLPADLLYDSVNLTSVIVGSGVAGIGDEAFGSCEKLASVLFLGVPPAATGTNQNIFGNSSPEVFYLPGTAGWQTHFAGRPASAFLPETVQIVFTNTDFAFAWSGTGLIPMNVQRRTSLVSGSWTNVAVGVTDGFFIDGGAPSGSAYYRAVLP